MFLSGCSDRAEKHLEILKSCDPGATISIGVSTGVFGSTLETKCSWVKPEKAES